MAITLDYERLMSNGRLTVLWALPNAIVNPAAPTATELNAALNMSKSISWNDWDFGTEASNTTDDPSLADEGNVVTRGAAQYGGGISFYFPQEWDVDSNNHSVVADAMTTRTRGYIIIRIDGNKPTTQAFAEGDYVNVYEVETDAETHMITGEEAFRYTMNFVQKSGLYTYTVVQGATASAVVVTGDETPAAGDVYRANATVAGREYTNGVVWTTSDPDVATVTNAGVVTITGSSTDTADIVATFEPTGESDTISITVT